MTKLQLEIHDDILRVLNKIKNLNDQGVELEIPEGSVLFDNIVNLKLIEQQAESMGISVIFSTDDEAGNALISNLDAGSNTIPFQTNDGEEQYEKEDSHILQGERAHKKPLFQKIHLKLPRIVMPVKKGLLIPALLVILLVGGYLTYGAKAPKADAKITLSSNPLTRSVTVKIKAGATTSQENYILKGTSVETISQTNGELATTGEKLVGEKAKGQVIIYNKSSDEITLKKGAEITYEKDDKEYRFTTNEEISIPSSYQESSEPGSSIIPGKGEVEVMAVDIGSGYNIDEGESMSIAKYKKSVLEAEAKKDFKGGKADKVKIVSEDDRKNLSKQLLDQGISGSEIALKSKIVSPNKFISGSVSAVVAKESFSHAVGDQTDKLTLEQTLTITGLTYSEKELNEMLSKLIDKIAPEGYTVSKKDWEVKIEALGNSSNSVLSSSEADIQATLKTSVVPIVDKEKIKQDISGKKASEAEKILGAIKNVKTYELKISPVVPFFNKVPKDLSKIEVVIENE